MHDKRQGWARTGRGPLRPLAAVLLALVLVLAACGPAAADAAGDKRPAFRPGVVLVGFGDGVAPARRRAIAAAYGRRERTLGGATLLRVRRDRVLATVRALRRRPEVRYAEPDYAMRVAATPDDPGFAQQWGPADEGATAAWDVTTGSRSIVIGEADTGVNYTHPDLAANIWSNPGTIGGCPAGTHGRNVVASSCDPMDDETHFKGHGTHVAGILGAVGNNAMGVAGVNWTTTILPVKWVDSHGSGSTSGLIAALEWLVEAKQHGVNIRVVNDSQTFVGTEYSQALSDEIDTLGDNDILFVTAAGNSGEDNDDPAKRRYPCGYNRPNEICVAATNQSDRLPDWANYGDQTVDLAAPGDEIYSTLLAQPYGVVSGSSMAAPQVAGAAALILSHVDLSATELKAALLDSVDRLPALDGLVRTGGRLNVCRALPGCSAPPNPPAPATFGTTTVGSSSEPFDADRKRVNAATLTEAGSITKLRVFLERDPGTANEQQLRGVVYADDHGAPGRLLGTTDEFTYHDGDDRAWYDLSFSTPLSLGPGRYWLGVLSSGGGNARFRWTSDTASRQVNADAYADGATDPFGPAGSVDDKRMSLYAVYAPAPASGGTPPPSPPAQGGGGSTAPGGEQAPVVDDGGTAPAVPGGEAAPGAGSGRGGSSACPATSSLAGAAARPRGRALAISVARDRPVDVDVLRQSAGSARRVARFTRRRSAFTWSAAADGVYVVRFAAGTDERSVVVERRAGRFRTRPPFRASSPCGTVRLFALDAPVFGGRARHALGISYRLGTAGRVELRVTRAGRTVRRYAPQAVRAGRLVQLQLAAAAAGRGDVRVVLTVTAAGRTVTRTLTARRL